MAEVHLVVADAHAVGRDIHHQIAGPELLGVILGQTANAALELEHGEREPDEGVGTGIQPRHRVTVRIVARDRDHDRGAAPGDRLDERAEREPHDIGGDRDEPGGRATDRDQGGCGIRQHLEHDRPIGELRGEFGGDAVGRRRNGDDTVTGHDHPNRPEM